MATYIPNAKQQFCDSNGNPLSGGSVGMYLVSTLTPKNTWQDSAQTSLNANPVPLDSGGYCMIYGTGQYRQVVKDSLGNTIWDQVVSIGPQFGTVTQTTSKSTAVTLNQMAGQIVTTSDSMTAGSTAEFILNNSYIATIDTVNVNVSFASNTHGVLQYRVRCGNQGYGPGQIAIELENISGSTLSDAVTINFVVLKAS